MLEHASHSLSDGWEGCGIELDIPTIVDGCGGADKIDQKVALDSPVKERTVDNCRIAKLATLLRQLIQSLQNVDLVGKQR